MDHQVTLLDDIAHRSQAQTEMFRRIVHRQPFNLFHVWTSSHHTTSLRKTVNGYAPNIFFALSCILGLIPPVSMLMFLLDAGNNGEKRREKMTKETYRIVAMAMGGWKWGYPRGQRQGIVHYVEGTLKDGRKVWKSNGSVCDGLTAANEEHYKKYFPEAFSEPEGSIHNEEIN
jgi:hypothetical protein